MDLLSGYKKSEFSSFTDLVAKKNGFQEWNVIIIMIQKRIFKRYNKT